jgi:hypothetical protein
MWFMRTVDENLKLLDSWALRQHFGPVANLPSLRHSQVEILRESRLQTRESSLRVVGDLLDHHPTTHHQTQPHTPQTPSSLPL